MKVEKDTVLHIYLLVNKVMKYGLTQWYPRQIPNLEVLVLISGKGHKVIYNAVYSVLSGGVYLN